MKLTIITITYNNVVGLVKTVRSVSSQRIHPSLFQHLIIDGKSNDGTIEFCEEENLQFFSEKDEGIYDAFNKGVQKAAGKFIVFLNAGDVFSDDSVVSNYLKVIETNKPIYWLKNVHINNKGKITRETTVPYWAVKYLKIMPPHQATIFSRKLISNSLYIKDFNISGDFDWFIRNYDAYLEGEFQNRVVVNQEIGGISNNGLSSIVQGNKEALRSLRKHSKMPYLYLLIKITYKFILRCRNLIY